MSTNSLPLLVSLEHYLIFHNIVCMYTGRHGEQDSPDDNDYGYCDAIAESMGLMGAGHSDGRGRVERGNCCRVEAVAHKLPLQRCPDSHDALTVTEWVFGSGYS